MQSPSTGDALPSVCSPATTPAELQDTAANMSSPIRGSSPRSPSPTMAELESFVAPSAPLRRGKWTKEEEVYANHLIDEFQKGFLDIKQFTTLRSFLAEELHCQTMRLSKKFHGKAAIGLQMYNEMNPAMRHLPEVVEAIEKSCARRAELRLKFLKSLHRLQQLMAAYAISVSTDIKPMMSAAKESAQQPSPVAVKAPAAAKSTPSFSAMLAPSARPAATATKAKAVPIIAPKSAPKTVPPTIAQPQAQHLHQMPVAGLHDSMMPQYPVFSAPMTSMPSSTPAPSVMPSQTPMTYVPIMMSSNGFGTFMMPMQGAMPQQGMGGFGGMWPMVPQQQFAPQGYSMMPTSLPQFAMQSPMMQQPPRPMQMTHAVEVLPPSSLPLSRPL